MIWAYSLALFLVFSMQSAPVNAGQLGLATFELDWPDAPDSHWSIEVSTNGTGRYDLLPAGTRPTDATKRTLVLTPETEQRIQSGSRTVAEGDCETKTKNIAKTGSKHIAFKAANSDTWSSCTFNYSDDKNLMDAVAAFQAIAETIQTGERLQRAHRYDRLSLDAEIEHLDQEVKEGHAIELQNIAPVLRSIADDERVIERARRKAARLIEASYAAPSSER